jgi:uncharacterized protein HemY
MTLKLLINLAGTVVFIYALWLSLIGLTYIVTELFMDWFSQFKQARKNKAAKNGKDGQ